MLVYLHICICVYNISDEAASGNFTTSASGRPDVIPIRDGSPGEKYMWCVVALLRTDKPKGEIS